VSAARRHKKHHHEEHENHERWLVSGYDMMTLLFAVFVVLYAISSTNISKVKALQQSLQEAFSGPVLTGGRAMMKTVTALASRDRRVTILSTTRPSPSWRRRATARSVISSVSSASATTRPQSSWSAWRRKAWSDPRLAKPAVDATC